MQAHLFEEPPLAVDLGDGCTLDHHPAFLPAADADRLLAAVLETTPWTQEHIRMYGREVPVPRLTAWHGEPGHAYTYSGITMQPRPWTPALDEIRRRLEASARVPSNSVLVNLYRSGADGVAWHSDDEDGLGPDPVIASVSLGATRRFVLRHKRDTRRRHVMDLEHGSLLVMRGATQARWQHQVPKTARAVEARINLTFRTILPTAPRRP
jgi:alkylated DNA repair dioxygenase AlkB